MKTTDDDKLKDKLGTTNPFTVPEGYFEAFTRQLMEKLPEHEDTSLTLHVTVWQRVRPWLYMAAMFGGIMLGMRYMLSLGDPSPDAVHSMATVAIPAEDDSYYEEYLRDVVIHSSMDDYTVYCCLNDSEENS